MERHALVRAQQRRRRIKIAYNAAGFMGNVIFTCLVILLSFLVYFLVQSRMVGGPSVIAGHRVLAVISGSMSPTINTGSLVLVKPVDAAELVEGDIITFGSVNGQLVTHRITEVISKPELSFVTKGDANEVTDSGTVAADKVIGAVTLTIPLLGRVLAFSQTKHGLLLMIMVPALVILIVEWRNLWLYAVEVDKAREAELAKCEAYKALNILFRN